MARRSTLRASDADRDGVVERLREAAGEGRIAAHELEQRIADALRARTYGELDATVSDLPDPRTPSRQRTTAGWAVATVRAHPALLLVAIPVAMVIVAAMIAVAMAWAAITILALVLGHHRRMVCHRGCPRVGPWRYGGPPARRPGYWA
jgi:hypothetical protein